MVISNNSIQSQLQKTFEVFIAKTPVNTNALQDINKQKQDTFEKKYGMLYTTAALATGIGIGVVLFRGGKFSDFNRFIQKHYTSLAAKTAEAKNNFNNLDLIQKIKYRVSEGFIYTMKRMQAFGNINPIKDIAFDRITKFLHLKPMFDEITNCFTKLSKNLTAKQYKAPKKALDNFKRQLGVIAKDLRKSNNPNAEAFLQKIEKLYNISEKELGNIIKDFPERFDNVLFVLNAPAKARTATSSAPFKRSFIENAFLSEPMTSLFTDFIPARKIAATKKIIFGGLFNSKSNLSNSVLDLSKTMNSSIDIIYRNASMDQPAVRKSYFELKKLIESFEKPKIFNIDHRIAVKQGIINKLDEVKSFFNDALSTQTIDELQEYIKADKKGAIEQIVSLCKTFGLKETNPKEFAKLLNLRDKFQNKLNDAVKFETESTFNKMLDYSLHSIPTDMMTQLIGTGTLLYIMFNRNNSKDERVSSTLKNGIPIVGGLAVMFASNVRQVASGPSALFLGFLSSFILSRLGNVANRMYLAKKSEKTNNLVQKA